MKSSISQIDRALKKLYNLDSPLQAEDFLLRFPQGPSENTPPGVLYIEPPTEADDSLGLGIYFAAPIQKQLDTFEQWSSTWTGQQLSAFGVAAEEVSHFHYIAHHAPLGRGVSQLELEFQGEIDKFLITFFAQGSFEDLLEKFFENFHWFEKLGAEQKTRYEEANGLAKSFLVKNAELICSEPREKMLQFLRTFYRLSLEEKVSLARK